MERRAKIRPMTTTESTDPERCPGSDVLLDVGLHRVAAAHTIGLTIEACCPGCGLTVKVGTTRLTEHNRPRVGDWLALDYDPVYADEAHLEVQVVETFPGSADIDVTPIAGDDADNVWTIMLAEMTKGLVIVKALDNRAEMR